MPLFAVICRDKPDHLQTRLDTREVHLAYLGQSAGLQLAGPFLSDGKPCGSMLVVDAVDMKAATDWAANDPYALAGLFASVEVIEWRKVIG